MKVVLDKVFPLAASPASAWQLMQDIEAVAGCMPGAKITERIDDTHYKGTITVKLGPATMAFKGDIEVLALDAVTRSLHLMGKGTDSTGGSAATMDLTATVRDAGEAGNAAEACELAGKSEVTMSGKAAAIGGRLMGPVSEQLLKQFVANFSARLDALKAQAAEAAQADASAQSDGDAAVSGDTAATATTADAASTSSPGSPGSLGAAGSAGAPRARPAVVAAPPPAPGAELNGFAFIWAILRDWLRGLFSRKAPGR